MPHRLQLYTTTEEAWTAMYAEICAATQSIFWELYLFEDDEIGNKFADALIDRVEQGVLVCLVLDRFGSEWPINSVVDRMLNGGVHVRYFGTKSQLSWYQKPLVLWRQMVFRNHRKLLVIDERIAYLGGVNISARSKHWKDFHMRIVGKTVPYLLRVFANSYVLSGGNPQLVASYLSPMIKKTSGSDIHYVFDYGRGKRSAAKRVYRQALDQAQDTVYLCTPYYAPGKRFIRAIKRALKRGVRVVLIIPEHSDIWITQVTALPWLQVLSSMGVEIYQTHSMVHGKGVVVDDRWAMIGSSNLHQASFRDNYEANARITKKEIVKDIRAAMHALIDDATAFSLEDAQKTHSWMSRALGTWFSYLTDWWYQ